MNTDKMKNKTLVLMNWALVVGIFSSVSSFAFGTSSVPSVSPAPNSSPQSAQNPKILLAEFVRAQNTEVKALEHRQKLETKELKTSQKIKLSEWEKKEKEDRHKYFETHAKGPERREYIQDFLKRRDEFRKKQGDERKKQILDFDTQLHDLKRNQEMKLKEFQKYLDSKETPPGRLWPTPGH